MHLLHNSLLLISIFYLAFFQAPSKVDDPFLTNCFEPSNYTSGSQFQSNLNHLFASLYAQAPSNNGFAISVSGDVPNRIYGLIQCRGDISTEDCQKCVNDSAMAVVKQCPFRKQGAVRFDHCVLHYSDSQFFSQTQNSMIVYKWVLGDVSDPVRFNEKLGGLVNNLSGIAASSSSKYAAGETKFTDFENIYGMLQCTRDLSVSDCLSCLTEMISRIQDCCNGTRPVVTIASISCYVAYDKLPFFNLSKLSPPSSPVDESPPPPPALPLSPPLTHHDDHNSATNDTATTGKAKSSRIIAVIVVPMATTVVIASAICTLLLWRKARKKQEDAEDLEITTDEELLLMDLTALRVATGNFSDVNKLGEGGFGSVYKGKLLDGREVAVKRLSSNSTQGIEEFRTEVHLVAKLGHRNLVSLLGCCLEEKEKLLVYEYLPNGSLDRFLFGGADHVKHERLDWQRRYKIIEGIAQGLLYLHQESQLRIIHRDLKAANILLDEDLNPKISDFGLARLFKESGYIERTKVAGTYGYMPPEYVIHGRLSTKSDVFSFGILVLEIVTGRNIVSFHNSDFGNLQTYAWQHWRRNNYFELLDPSLGDRYTRSEVLRCIHIGLLCVQEDMVARPIMSAIVVMLSCDSMTLAAPSEPAFLFNSGRIESVISSDRNARKTDPSSTRPRPPSVNCVTITELDPR